MDKINKPSDSEQKIILHKIQFKRPRNHGTIHITETVIPNARIATKAILRRNLPHTDRLQYQVRDATVYLAPYS
jgi:hypothetical protein